MINEQLYKSITAAEKILAELRHDALWRFNLLKHLAPHKIPLLKSYIDEIELLLLKDESKQPQPPISQTPMLGEVPPVVNIGTEENSQAVEGATPVVRQNEQTKKVCQCSSVDRFTGWTEADGCYCCSCGKPIGCDRPG